MALHILMMYATAGNLDTFIQARCSSSSPTAALHPDGDSFAALSKAERIKAFKRRRSSMAGDKASPPVEASEHRGVLLLGKEEIGKLFGDVVDGLAFLVSQARGQSLTPACERNTPSRPQVLKRTVALGRRPAHVGYKAFV